LRSSGERAVENEAEFVERCATWMSDRLRNDSPWRCWVVEQDGEIIGNIWVQLIEKIPNPAGESETHAYITSFYVREKARARGVGSQLLSHVLSWCRERRVNAVILWPSDRSRSLYLRHGFDVPEDLLELITTK
jgi:GNAT superfamily N-acetyltransferase